MKRLISVIFFTVVNFILNTALATETNPWQMMMGSNLNYGEQSQMEDKRYSRSKWDEYARLMGQAKKTCKKADCKSC